MGVSGLLGCLGNQDPLKDPKNRNPPNMNPLLHWGDKGIIRGFHFLDPVGGLRILG